MTGKGQAITMTTGGTGSARSMKYSLDEVFSGMLASSAHDTFSNDAVRLAAAFEGLAGSYPMFAPFANGVDPAAVSAALTAMEKRKMVKQEGNAFVLTTEGRAACASSKRTLFNGSDRVQLEEAAEAFDAAIQVN